MRRILAGLIVLPLLAVAVWGQEPSSDDAAELAQYDVLIQAADRQHWSFQALRRLEIPSVENTVWVRNPIDHFVLSKLESRGWQPSPPAESRALVRRIYLDVIGLPPSLEEQEAFLKDPSAEAVERMVEELLARPDYGEHWGRYWLDLVRYAETNGYERDATKPFVWRYRDYVIRALNSDKPFDRFLLEQLAGDELANADEETMIATGYYRLAPWDDEPADPQQDRFDQLDDMVRTTSQVLLGLTLGCARCHNHKFDALTMHDYYRMAAVFHTLERPRNGRTELDVPLGSRAQVAALRERDAKLSGLDEQIRVLREQVRAELLASGKTTLPAEVVAAFRVAAQQRSDTQKNLVADHTAQLDKEVEAAVLDDVKEKISTLRRARDMLREEIPDLPRGYAMHEPSPEAPATHVLLRGRASRPGPRVEAGVPAVLVEQQPSPPAPGTYTSLRRLALARWIASPENPLTARVIVNRVWQYHFGEGLVRTPSDFGVMGEPPTHPELLDWLAHWFVTDVDWSLKKLHRLILSSNTYRMSKAWNPQYGAEDPEDRLLWRVPYRRLAAEAICDSMLAVTGKLNRKMYGPSMYPYVPKEALEGHSDPDKIWQPFDEAEASRRTVYAFIKRSMVVPMLEVLDFCDTTQSAEKRVITSVAPQALTLFNGEFVNRQARHFAARLMEEAGSDLFRQIERAYLLALCRPPSEAELAALQRFLAQEAERSLEESTSTGQPLTADAARHRALEQMCRVIFNMNEFVYVQ